MLSQLLKKISRKLERHKLLDNLLLGLIFFGSLYFGLNYLLNNYVYHIISPSVFIFILFIIVGIADLVIFGNWIIKKIKARVGVHS